VALVLAVSGIASGQPEEYWGVHLWQSMEDGEIYYAFDAYSSFGGTVTTPLDETLLMGGQNEETLSDLEARFPDGTYIFDDGVGGIHYAELSDPFPGEFPNITSSTFDPDGNLTITWVPWELVKSNPVICIMMENSDYYVELDPDATEHTILASEIPPTCPLGVMVQFKNRTIEVGGSTHGDKIKGASVEVPCEGPEGPEIEATIDIDPDTLNLQSKGKWITCYIRLPEGYYATDVLLGSIRLEYQIEPECTRVNEEEQVVMAKFSRSIVQDILDVGDVELTISGKLTDGTIFEGTDIVRVIDKGGKK